jgi:hypothetical protein
MTLMPALLMIGAWLEIVLLSTSPAGWQLGNYTTRFHILGCAPAGFAEHF